MTDMMMNPECPLCKSEMERHGLQFKCKNKECEFSAPDAVAKGFPQFKKPYEDLINSLLSGSPDFDLAKIFGGSYGKSSN